MTRIRSARATTNDYSETTILTVDERIADFKKNLTGRTSADLVQQYLTHGACHVLSESQYFQLKSAVAQKFNVHHSEVIVVGSAKLGFSVVPEKRYRPFGDASDIDVAICSGALYDSIWRDVFDYWARGEQWPHFHSFRKYHFRGWMRPDKLPPVASFERANAWWEFFRALRAGGKFGPYRINGALYKEWSFLEKYQVTCMHGCKAEAG